MIAFLIWLSALYAAYYSLVAAIGRSGKPPFAKARPPAKLTFTEQCAPADAGARMAESRGEAGPAGAAIPGRGIRAEKMPSEKTMKQYQLEAKQEAAEFTKKISF